MIMITARSIIAPQARFGKSLEPGSPAGAVAFRVVLAMYMIMPAAIKKIKPMTVFPFAFDRPYYFSIPLEIFQ